ncbi:MAG: IS5 family transposase [Richelia sp.]|nr:IS5 family transposase [Richelia sp.]
MEEKKVGELEQRYQKLESKKTLLMKLNETVPWSEFRPILEQVHDKPRKNNAGRKPIAPIVMFKMLGLQQLYNITDEELDYQVNDRLSFMRFLGVGLAQPVPDATTVCLFRQQLKQQSLIEELFEQFDRDLRHQGYQAKGGQIVDATVIPVPKQDNTKEEKQKLAQGEIPESWQEKPHRLSWKDTDASWTKNNGQSSFGYKKHISIDVKYGFLRRYQVTHASVHDYQVLGALLDDQNQGEEVWANSAYRSESIECILQILQFLSHIHEQANRNHPLTAKQK